MPREIGIYGGTFSPPHAGHIRAAEIFCKYVKPERFFIVATAIPPHKLLASGDKPADRLNMLRLAFADFYCKNRENRDVLEISDYEIRREGISYTADTLEYFASVYPTERDYRLTFLCGTDMFLTLAEWYRPDKIFNLCRIAHTRRESEDTETERKIAERTLYYKSKFDADILPLPGKAIEISSTELRRMIAAGEDTSGFLSPAVAAYIKENGLYK